ncbi:MAG TPA: ATP-binding cassette domain-containing protein [Solirubrobacterales bacterium]|nr:ATP-binding cassette domain-containing protein [Solirubrobacterales bacterium]
MSALIVSASAVSFEYRDRTILDNIDLRVHDGDRTALVGANGSGKSTLLRLLAGLETPSGGEISAVAGARIAYLPQVSGQDAGLTVGRELAGRIGVADAEAEMDRLTGRLADGDLSVLEAHAAAVEQWSNLGGGDFEARIGPALESVGVDRSWAERECRSLSGGQMARVRLAALRLARLDCALLDEPSNHLDADGLEMLDRIVAEAEFAIVFASHDRGLLERRAHDVVELDRTHARQYRGGWATYLREREAERNAAETSYAEATAERDRLVTLERRIRQQGEIGQRRAKRSGETDKHVRYAAIQSAQKNTAASGIAKRIENVEIPEKPWKENLSRLLLDSAQPVHATAVAVVREVILERDEWHSRPIDLAIGSGERILLRGANGAGKSSLIAALTGRLEPVAGRIEIPASLRFTELAQRGGVLEGRERPLIEEFRELSGLGETAARTALAAMRLGPERVSRAPGLLSPGERTRAELALLAKRPAACLFLDEPSNHLDIEAMEVLESALEGWTGSLVLASHDPAMREKVRIDRVVDL